MLMLGHLLYLILAQEAIPNPPNAPSALTYIWWVIAALIIIGGSLIILLSKKRQDVQVTDEKRAASAEALVRTRDTQLADIQKRMEKLEIINADLESENAVMSGVKISELFKFWENKTQIETEMDALKSELRRTKLTLKKWEDGDLK